MAEKAGIRDEFDGTPLPLLAERFRSSGVKVLVGCGLDDDPYGDSSGAVLRECAREAAEGLRLFALACGAQRSMLAATSFYTWRRVVASEKETPLFPWEEERLPGVFWRASSAGPWEKRDL